jgi:NADPH-dependent ferric siderophore reductase
MNLGTGPRPFRCPRCPLSTRRELSEVDFARWDGRCRPEPHRKKGEFDETTRGVHRIEIDCPKHCTDSKPAQGWAFGARPEYASSVVGPDGVGRPGAALDDHLLLPALGESLRG